ncbi:dipeptide epimerase [Chitinophagaceae bacterium LB-8]|uniref:Dipeptide epimerase n=1 Tax=Paraflavisolibacter caeni TaxID=2982496 RepID=A0A9X2XZ78_9BACT|nr:dipeptide epimerase [Paraflavisolibacter caeni]MCU7551577.1 dipeptide epimerase [Paraflavisolibacter caeni]
MKLLYKSFNLPFQYPFTISKGTKTHQPTLVVALSHLGQTGFGEAPAISYYQITVEKMIEDLERKKMFVEKFAFTEPQRYWHYLHHLFPQNNFLVSALDMAGWDLWGKIKRKGLAEFWDAAQKPLPLTDYTIGLDSIEQMVQKLKAHPWPIYKIKLGVEQDIEIVSELRKHTNALFRVDVNAAWTLEEALRKIPLLEALGVELIEQPLNAGDWEGMQHLYKQTSIQLIADESCVTEGDIEKCAGHFHGINIKLTKCSGITPALRMIERARQLNLKIMLGSMNECSIGSAALVHLSPLVDYLDADGPLLLEQDLAIGLEYNKGGVSLPVGYGLGVQPNESIFLS